MSTGSRDGAGAKVPGDSTLRRRVVRPLVFALALIVLPSAGWVILHGRYDSWHPCDWLLQDRVELMLRRQGLEPDAVPVPVKASLAESAEVRAVLQLRRTPMQCLGTLAAARVLR